MNKGVPYSPDQGLRLNWSNERMNLIEKFDSKEDCQENYLAIRRTLHINILH